MQSLVDVHSDGLDVPPPSTSLSEPAPVPVPLADASSLSYSRNSFVGPLSFCCQMPGTTRNKTARKHNRVESCELVSGLPVSTVAWRICKPAQLSPP